MESQSFTPELLNHLITLAKRENPDNFSVYDSCGGKYDEAYYIGCDHGETWLARLILDKLEIKY